MSSLSNNMYDAVIADLEAKRDHLSAMIEGLKKLRDMAIALPTGMATAAFPTAADVEFRHDSFFGMTIPEAVKKYLAARKQTASIPDISDALTKYGLKTTAKNFRETVRAIISRQPEFVKINSEWGLAEWYPAGARRKNRKTDEADAAPTESGSGEEGDAQDAVAEGA